MNDEHAIDQASPQDPPDTEPKPVRESILPPSSDLTARLTAVEKRLSSMERWLGSTIPQKPAQAPSPQKVPIRMMAGWNEIQDNTQLVGTAIWHEYSSEDGDWNLFVRPNPEYQYLLRNRANIENKPSDFVKDGQHVSEKVVTCEIRPAGEFGGGDNEKKYLERMRGKEVTVYGMWAEDTGHDNWTEIHPITWITCWDGFFWNIFVFSDDSHNLPNHVLHSHENRTASIVLEMPFRHCDIVEESDRKRARSVNYQMWVRSDNSYYLKIDVESGTPDEGKGYYYAKVNIYPPANS